MAGSDAQSSHATKNPMFWFYLFGASVLGKAARYYSPTDVIRRAMVEAGLARRVEIERYLAPPISRAEKASRRLQSDCTPSLRVLINLSKNNAIVQ